MERVESKSYDATVTASSSKPISMPGLVISATLTTMSFPHFNINNQYTFPENDVKQISQPLVWNSDADLYTKGKIIQDEGETREVKVSTITKDELNAKLAQNKAEVEAVSSGMKTEMANFRTAYIENFAEISKTLSRIESKTDATEKRLTQAQWIVSLVISVCAVTLSAVIFFSNKSDRKPVQPPLSVEQNKTQATGPNPTTSQGS